VFDVASENSFDFLSDEYRALFEDSRATAFQHPLWLDRLYRRLAPHLDVEPLVISVRWSDNGRLAMILPLIRRRYGVMKVIEFADLKVCDYASPICDDATFALILRNETACDQIRKALQPHDLLRIQKLREETLPVDRLLGTASRSSMNMNAHSVPLYGPFAKWRADNMDPLYRKELDKKGRRIRRKGDLRFEVCRDPELIKATFHSMREYRKRRFQDCADPDLVQSSLYFEFYLELAIAGANAGLCRTYTLSLDGRPISCVWGLKHRSQFLTVLGGFDLANYKNYSIGALVFEGIAGDCIEKGETVLDFTIGNESYKRLFGAQPTGMWMISRSGSSLGLLVGLVTKQMPWTIRVARRLMNRRIPS